MTPREAEDLAVRILGCFNGPNAHEWEQELLTLNAGTAGTAFARLRREHKQRWLSIADYHATYQALNTTDATNRRDPCPECGDSGWTTAGQYIAHDQLYTGAEPCTCQAGQIARSSSLWRNAPERRFITDTEAATHMQHARSATDDPLA
jgi:hypothetical protein